MEFDARIWSFDGNLFFSFAGAALNEQADKNTADHWVEHLSLFQISSVPFKGNAELSWA